uniref:Uncharacterized protein n=1 Tax=Oryza glumipatula TaxID=40148 RepID=A0A0E0ABK8_9ORYZ
MTKIPLILSHLLSLISVFLLSLWLGGTVGDGDDGGASGDGDSGCAPRDRESGGAAGYGEGRDTDRDGGDATGDREAGTWLGTGTVAAPTWLGQVGMFSYMAPPSQQRRRAEQPSSTHAGAVPVPSRASAAHLIADPISILLDDLLLECLAGVPYATLPQLPTTSPRSLSPSRPRRAPSLILHPLRQAL